MKKFGLIGKTLGHSFSQGFFSKYFKENNINASYQNFELDSIEEVRSLLKSDVVGFNVTIPYKEAIIPFLDDVDENAKNIGAVNVVYRSKDKWIGANTDAYGFGQAVKPFLANQHEKALLLGTGGASKAIAYYLKGLGIDVLYLSRNPQKELEFSYDEVNEFMLDACQLIVNCTPVGTFPNIHDCIDLPFEFLTENHLVVDLIYNPEETEFIKRAKQQNAMVMNGLSMLKHQALKSFEIWNNG